RIVGQGEPKYLNSPESEVFEKRYVLFNFDKAQQPARDAKQIIATEGQLDVISLYQAGFKNTVASSGTALTEYQISFMWQTCDEPLICFDGDAAGLKASIRAAHRILPYLKTDKSLKFVILPEGQDPDTIVNQENGVELFKEILSKPISLIDILWKEAVYGQTFSTPEQKAGLEKRLFDLVEEIQDEKVKRYYLQTIKSYLWEYFKHRAEFKKRTSQNKEFVVANENLKTLLAYLTLYPEIKSKYLGSVGRLMLGNNEIDSTLINIYNSLENDENLTDYHKNKLKTQLISLSQKNDPDFIIDEEFSKILSHNSLHFMELELSELEERMKTNPSADLFQRFVAVKQEIEKIKSQY
ncbi:MAG: toprim domain-containing protein, partial [Rickettsiales bacterium]|nr:toprim domain-containing protein [Rickettsiales bacterium]